jgi:serine/threonine protein phosphatase PrpC
MTTGESYIIKQGLSIDFGASTDVGRVRDDNQDTFGIFPPDGNNNPPSSGRLFIVADGMGGHKGGKVASGLAVKTIGEVYFSDGNESVQESLVNAFQAANEVVASASKKDPALSGMGTTCVAMVAKGSSVFVAHIGDGTKPEAAADVQPESIVFGEEWFVLCTDGLSNMVADDEIHDITVAQPPQNACNQLVSLANERGGIDNITVIVVRVTAP